MKAKSFIAVLFLCISFFIVPNVLAQDLKHDTDRLGNDATPIPIPGPEPKSATPIPIPGPQP